MATPFRRTLRALGADRSRRSWFTVLGATCFLFLVGGWLTFGRIRIYRTSDSARLEVDTQAHPVEAPVAGRIVENRLKLGVTFDAGDVVVRLENDAFRLDLAEEQARRDAATSQLAVLRQEAIALEAAMQSDAEALKSSVDAANARWHEASNALTFQTANVARVRALAKESLNSEIDLLHAEQAAQQARDTAESMKLEVARVQTTLRTQLNDRQVNIERLKRDISTAEGQLATSEATMSRLMYETGLRSITTPVAGRVAESAQLPIGTMVSQGQRLGAVLPQGNVRVVAQFSPGAAVGRIRPGQSARVRLDSFPWTQYGVLDATVVQCGSEPREGKIRVELSVQENSRIPIQHGLTGDVEIEVERIAPITLGLRTVGQVVVRNGTAPPASPAEGATSGL